MIAKRSRALTHGQRERLDRAFLHDGSVDRPTYERQRHQVASEFVAASRGSFVTAWPTSHRHVRRERLGCGQCR